MIRVLVVGGTGVVGDRLVTVLLESTSFDVVLAARDAKRLAAAVARLERVSSMVMDVQRVTAADLRATGAFAVVDAAGPFQHARHRLAAAAIEAGLHYVDLADALDFAAGFGDLDAAARAAGVVALTGASSTPALSNAALDTITMGWRAVHRVEVALSPGNRAPRGLSVMCSILGKRPGCRFGSAAA